MRVAWRLLLDEIRVPWIDRGRNTSSGNLNVKCPLCGDDPSHHLSISETIEAWYCLREPNRHRGRNFTRLLVVLGQSPNEAARLLRRHALDGAKPIAAPHPRSDDQIDLSDEWRHFELAGDQDRCLAYLNKRKFTQPKELAKRYDLRYARLGAWSWRLLIPFKQDNRVVGWTGRDISGKAELKYLTKETGGAPVVYFPDAAKQHARSLVVVEGPLDALRVADACQYIPFRVAALLGKQLAAIKLLALRDAASGCVEILDGLDADVPLATHQFLASELRAATGIAKIGRLRLPWATKDPGELNNEGILSWLSTASCLPRSVTGNYRASG